MSAVADGLVAAELAREDWQHRHLPWVHSGLAMNAIGLLGSDWQKERWVRPLATVEQIGASASRIGWPSRVSVP
jgi:glutaryl-CoA dehydrogenase